MLSSLLFQQPVPPVQLGMWTIDRSLFFIVVGAALTAFFSFLIALVQHLLKLREDRIIRDRDKEDLDRSTLHSDLGPGGASAIPTIETIEKLSQLSRLLKDESERKLLTRLEAQILEAQIIDDLLFALEDAERMAILAQASKDLAKERQVAEVLEETRKMLPESDSSDIALRYIDAVEEIANNPEARLLLPLELLSSVLVAGAYETTKEQATRTKGASPT